MKWFDWLSLAGVLCVILAGFLVYVPLGLCLTGAGCLTIGIGVNRVMRHKAMARGEDYD
jgi:hypothetical protein